MLDQIPVKTLKEWIIYYEVEPFGADDLTLAKRADWRAGMQAANIRNINRKRGSRRSKIEDFTPKYGQKRQQTSAEMWQAIEGHKAALDRRLGLTP